jgi:hypothetical protein
MERPHRGDLDMLAESRREASLDDAMINAEIMQLAGRLLCQFPAMHQEEDVQPAGHRIRGKRRGNDRFAATGWGYEEDVFLRCLDSGPDALKHGSLIVAQLRRLP